MVASTTLSAPGPYTLEGIRLGWQGYVRAFTPLARFNIFMPDMSKVEVSVPVTLTELALKGVTLDLTNGVVLC